MKRALFSITLIFMLFATSACQTNDLKEFEKLKLGMDKDEVLGIMGSPRRSERRLGQDRWTYVFYNQGQLHQKSVLFDENKASYVGDPIQPAVSAAEQDQKNEVENAALESKWAEQRIEHRKQSEEYLNSSESKPRYVPKFEPVQ